MGASGAVAMTRHRHRQCGTHLLNQPNLLDGAKRQLAHEIHSWTTVQWFDYPSLGAMGFVNGLLQTNLVGFGGNPPWYLMFWG
jgi:hypothetical protein